MMKKFSIFLAIIFFVLMTFAFLHGYFPKNLLLAYMGLSAVVFVFYALDKTKARRGAWRISERTLHFLALIGGWPGAAIAQQTLRHKTQKRSFQIIFWLTVMMNCTALAWLMSSNGTRLLDIIN